MKYLIVISALCMIALSVGEEQQSHRGMIDLDTWLRTPMGVASLKQCGCHYDGTHIIIDEMAQYERMLEINKKIEYYKEQEQFIENSLREAREYFRENTEAVENLKRTQENAIREFGELDPQLQKEVLMTAEEAEKVKQKMNTLREEIARFGPNQTIPLLLPSDP